MPHKKRHSLVNETETILSSEHEHVQFRSLKEYVTHVLATQTRP
jgi:hypothetical protein